MIGIATHENTIAEDPPLLIFGAPKSERKRIFQVFVFAAEQDPTEIHRQMVWTSDANSTKAGATT